MGRFKRRVEVSAFDAVKEEKERKEDINCVESGEEETQTQQSCVEEGTTSKPAPFWQGNAPDR